MIAAAIAQEIGREVDYRDVESLIGRPVAPTMETVLSTVSSLILGPARRPTPGRRSGARTVPTGGLG